MVCSESGYIHKREREREERHDEGRKKERSCMEWYLVQYAHTILLPLCMSSALATNYYPLAGSGV